MHVSVRVCVPRKGMNQVLGGSAHCYLSRHEVVMNTCFGPYTVLGFWGAQFMEENSICPQGAHSLREGEPHM